METFGVDFSYWAANAESIVISLLRAVSKSIGSTEFISPLVGAFCGTGAAFVLESYRRRREKKERRHEALLRAQ